MHVDGWTLALQAINLLVLLALLRWLFYRPLLKVIDQRRRAASDELARAQAAREQAQAQQHSLADERAALEASRQSLLQTAREEAARERAAAQDGAHREAARVVDEARRRADKLRRDAAQSLFDEAAHLACSLAERLLRQVPTANDEAFLQRLLEALSSTPASERRAWFTADSASALTVATARPIAVDARQRVEAALHQLLGADAGVDFEVDPQLLVGAELRFAHGVLSLHWAGELAAAREALRASAPGTVVTPTPTS
ncbi:MAG TPA: hypothetical protein VLE45_00210 [Burkholderiaceae bacterium]|nr:hypothetical protein [Burkholderiaceae bacterium]